MRRPWFGALWATVLIMVGACTSDEHATSPPTSSAATSERTSALDPKAEAYVEALAAVGADNPELSAVERRCLAEQTVEIVGVDAYEAAGITPDDLRNPLDQSAAPIMADLTAEQTAALNRGWTACTMGQRLDVAWLRELDAAGTELDKLYIGAVVVADDEQAYVALADGVLHTLRSADGTERWTFGTAGGDELFPTVSDDTVFVGTAGGVLYALDRDTGATRWSHDGAATGRPVIVAGLVVVSTGATSSPDRPSVEALDPATGAVRWSASLPYGVAAVAASGDVLVVSSSSITGSSGTPAAGDVSRLDPTTGTVLWTVLEAGTIAPALSSGGVFVLNDTTMAALDLDTGTQRWVADVTGTDYSGAVGGWPVQIAATSDVVVAVIGGDPWWVIGIDPATGHRLWEHQGDSEGGFDIATHDSDVIIAPSNVPFYLADPRSGDSKAYVDTTQLPVNENANPVTPRVAARSGELWIAAGGAWIVGLRQ